MISRREWLALVGKLGVIGAAASLGLSLPAHAVTRPTATLNPLFLNVSPRPVISSRTAPRLVTTLLTGPNGSSFGHDRYYRNAASLWTDNPNNTPLITWGYNVDGGQWFQCATEAAGVQRVWVNLTWVAVAGETYWLSFTVDSKTGTHQNQNVAIKNGTWAGISMLNNPALGRYAMGGLCTVGTATAGARIGIGVLNANAFDATIRYSNIMLERVPYGRAYPSEYIRPGDQQAFNYSRSSTITSGLESAIVIGSTYSTPRRSNVLVIGDSFTNDPGDFPWWLRSYLSRYNVAVTWAGVGGAKIADITGQLATALARQALTTTAPPYSVCIAEGGVNDVVARRTLAQMQTDRLAQIEAIRAAGMVPILVTVTPYEAGDAAQKALTASYNAWLKTLGYPLYDMYADADNGSAAFKTSWGSGDGTHPGQLAGQGMDIIGQRLADLVMLIVD